MYLANFTIQDPPFVLPQQEMLDLLTKVHQKPEMVEKYCCKPEKISQRYFSFDMNDLKLHQRGFGERAHLYADRVDRVFEKFYDQVKTPPDDLIHVTCTGYVSPSGGQKLVSKKGWATGVTHAYHMGCMGAIPAIRIASGYVATGKRSVDIVHTELCSLHLKGGEDRPDQLIVQSLFADGLIKYTLNDQGPGLEILAVHEEILPNTEEMMTWEIQDWGLRMTISKEVPAKISGSLERFVKKLEEKCGESLDQAIYAIHPGGPKIVEHVAKKLNLVDSQIEATKSVLYHRGNLSSATLPHIWANICENDQKGLIVGLAFGPGVSMFGVVLRK